MADDGLSAREEAAWRGFHEMRNLLLPQMARELAADAGLTEADYSILLALVESPGRTIGSAALLERLGWEPSRLSHQLSRMESRGTVMRRRCAGAPRSFELTITDAGLVAIRRASPGHLRAVRRWFVDALTPAQLDALADVAEAVKAHFASADAASGASTAQAADPACPPQD